MKVLVAHRVGAGAERPLVLTHRRRKVREAALGDFIWTVEPSGGRGARRIADDRSVLHRRES